MVPLGDATATSAPQPAGKMNSSQNLKIKLKELDDIEKEVAGALQSAGLALVELGKEKPSMKQVESNASNFIKTLQGVENGLSKHIIYLTQVSTVQPHEGSSYAAQKVFHMALHRLEHARSRMNELERLRQTHLQQDAQHNPPMPPQMAGGQQGQQQGPMGGQAMGAQSQMGGSQGSMGGGQGPQGMGGMQSPMGGSGIGQIGQSPGGPLGGSMQGSQMGMSPSQGQMGGPMNQQGTIMGQQGQMGGLGGGQMSGMGPMSQQNSMGQGVPIGHDQYGGSGIMGNAPGQMGMRPPGPGGMMGQQPPMGGMAGIGGIGGQMGPQGL
ncbi:keratin, type I cytoskeletal 9-like isoform X1 [Varroa jacobsoni]|uniref:keratin, type I cytoskeletal 9-like isoform X1 n=3 Tax=Varroa jacobsoni TaxID=62625 RepID=UPI000BF2B24D|nr:keratin, type I cytoskeletal 9-like isoform X1 [Varroa jacobsoni]